MDADGVSYLHICKKYHGFAEQKSWMIIVKIVDSIDILSCRQSSAKHAVCLMSWMTPLKLNMTGLLDKAIAKFNQDELCRYEKLFNTAYSANN